MNDKHWVTPYSVQHEDNAIRLLQFSSGVGKPVLVVPPQAGHHSSIADYGPNQSLVASAVKHTDSPIYAIEWKSCSFDRKDESIIDLLNQVKIAVEKVNDSCHLIGLCQGGWLSAIYSSLHPEKVESLTIAGAPIDTHAGSSVLHQITRLPFLWFKSLVVMSGGIMPGDLMLTGWKSGNPYQHYVKRYQNPTPDTKRFYQWYDYTQDLAGEWYLWAIDKLFQKNELGRNVLSINSTTVDLRQLSRLSKVNIVVGEKDDITPPEQSLALLKYVNANVHYTDAGHIGVFMSKNVISNTWNKLFTSINDAHETNRM